MSDSSLQDHIFISYATEDHHLAEWLTLKLTAEGYKVWCDRFKLLGGESYPRDIDKAIKEKTFRVLALLSKSSIQKENPLKERTLALNITRERKIDFLIPINVDGLKPTEIDWMSSDLTYIPFNKNWADGLKQLLKKLGEINTPKSLGEDGKSAAANVFLNNLEKDTREGAEKIHSNELKFEHIPDKIKQIHLGKNITWYGVKNFLGVWAAYFVDPTTLVSFEEPPKEIKEELEVMNIDDIEWKNQPDLNNITLDNIIKSLLTKSLQSKCLELGLLRTENRRNFYFPDNILKDNKIKFKGYNGKNTYVTATSLRNLKNLGKEYRFHMSPKFKVIKEGENYLVQVGLFLYLTEPNGYPLNPRYVFSRRKSIGRSWRNKEWFLRHLAIVGFLSNQDGKIVIGRNKESQVVLSTQFISFDSNVKLLETKASIEAESKIKDQIVMESELEDEDYDE